MNRIAFMLTLLAALCVAAPGQAYLARRVEADDRSTQEIARLTKELRQAKLGQIALLIEQRSEGKSRLLIGLGAGADLKAASGESKEFIHRASPAGASPLTVYPASSPVSVKLEGIGRCQLLGAVTTLVEANATGGDDRHNNVVAQPDVYLLAYGINEGWLEEVRLVAVTVDDEGRRQLRVVLRTLAKRSDARLIPAAMPEREPIPDAVVTFPGAEDVSADNPAWRATATLAWPKESYRFSLDLRITMI